MGSLVRILGFTAFAATINACAAISGLNAFSTGDCSGDCDAAADGTSVSSEAEADESAQPGIDATTDAADAGMDARDGAGVDGAIKADAGDASDADGADGTDGTDGADGTDGTDGEGGCGTGQLACDGGCVTAGTLSNCGSCGKQCTTGVANATATCVNDVCGFACKSGYSLCGNTCVLLTTASNCGGCGHVCNAEAGTPLCSSSGADGGAYTCVSGCSSSTPTLCGNACVNLTNDVNHCGGCGTVCSTNIANASPICISSGCAVTCNSGYTPCDAGVCAKTSSDNNNCGMCGNACTGMLTCQGGTCKCNASSCPNCGGTPCCRMDNSCGCNFGIGCF